MPRWCLRLFAASFVWLLAVSGATAEIPIEEFAKGSVLGLPLVSPDGTHVAVGQMLKDKSAIVVYDLYAPEGTKPFVHLTDLVDVNWLLWANNERLVIGVSVDRKIRRYGTFSVGRVLAINKDGSNPVILLNDSRSFRKNLSITTVTDLLPNDPDHILMPAFAGSRYNLYKVNVNDGSSELVEEGGKNTVDWVTDETGIARGRWDYNGRRQLLSLFVRTGKGDWDKVVEYGERDRIPVLNLVTFTERPNIAIVLSNSQSDRVGLYEFDLVAKTLGKLLFQHPKVDVINPVGSTLIDDVTGRLAGFSYVDDAPHFEYFDPLLKQIQAKLDATFPEIPQKSPLSWSKDRSVAIVYTEGPRDPGTYHLYNREDNSIGPFGERHPALKKELLSDSRRMDYAARDGMRISAYLTIPRGTAGKSLPLIVYPHGGPEVRDYLQYDPWAQAFASRGYAVLQPNFRGSGGYGKTFLQAGYGEWALKMQDDITDGVQKLIADGIADPKRICIVGASYGGYAALVGGAQTPDLYKCVISVSGVSDLPLLLDDMEDEYDDDSTVYQYELRRIGDPDKDKQRILAASPAYRAQSFKAPVLLIHGAKDDVAPVKQSRRMKAALEKAGKPVVYLELPEEGHSFASLASRVTALKAMESFLAKHLKTAPPS